MVNQAAHNLASELPPAEWQAAARVSLSHEHRHIADNMIAQASLCPDVRVAPSLPVYNIVDGLKHQVRRVVRVMTSRARAAAVLTTGLASVGAAFIMHPGQLFELRRSTTSGSAPLSHVMFEASGSCAMSAPTRRAWSKRRRSALMAAKRNKEQKQLDRWDQLLSDDPKQKQLIGYLLAVTVGLFALGSAAYNFGGQLLGLGFADDRLGYWDAAPSYAILLVYPPLALLYPEAKGLLLKTLVASFLATCVIYFFPYDAIGWAPTNEHVLITVAVPVLSYLSYFVWRADRVFTEIAEEDAAARTAKKDAAGDRVNSDR